VVCVSEFKRILSLLVRNVLGLSSQCSLFSVYIRFIWNVRASARGGRRMP